MTGASFNHMQTEVVGLDSKASKQYHRANESASVVYEHQLLNASACAAHMLQVRVQTFCHKVGNVIHSLASRHGQDMSSPADAWHARQELQLQLTAAHRKSDAATLVCTSMLYE